MSFDAAWIRDLIRETGEPYTCTRCDFADNPDLGPYFEFEFNNFQRQRAARAAVMLAQYASNAFLASHGMSFYSADSARFMSLAYYAGGFPMVKHCDGDPDSIYELGWYLVRPPGNSNPLEGNGVWRVHNYPPVTSVEGRPRDPNAAMNELDPVNEIGLSRLVGFISGQATRAHTLPPREAVSYPGAGSRRALFIPRYRVLTQSDAVNSAEITSTFNHRLFSTFKAGDSVFVDSQDGTTIAEHEFMIIGYGPAISFGVDLKEVGVSFDNVDGYGLVIQVNPKFPRISTVLVPYVVDWHVQSGNPATQRPRPFYFSRSGFLFDHNYWLFVPAVDRMIVRCDWYYASYPDLIPFPVPVP